MSGLHTARANLNVISHNISNMPIQGYSRQYTLQKAARPLSLNNGRGMYGTGSVVYGIAQIRNIYLDRKFWHQKSIQGEYEVKNNHMSLMETIFNELNDANILTGFTTFFRRLHDLSTTVPDATYRTNVLTTSETLVEIIRSNASALRKQQIDVNREINDTVNMINSLGHQITSLNRQIHRFELDGSNANDLRDQRALLIDKLSEFVNVDVKEYNYGTKDNPFNKKYTVMINGTEFINHDRYEPLMVVARDSNGGHTATGKHIPAKDKHNIMDADGLFDIFFSNSGREFNIYSETLRGSLRGLVDIRDGNNRIVTAGHTTTTFKGIPFYMNKLNSLVQAFAKAVNEGVDVNGNKIPGMTGHRNAFDYYGNRGGALFTFMADGLPVDITDYSQLNCLNIVINPQIMNQPFLLACSSDPTMGESNNDVILGIQSLVNYPSLFREGRLLDFIIGMADHMAIDHNQAKTYTLSYIEITMQTDNQRLSVSGVDLNEEMIDMLRYQTLYQACAKLINAIDEIYNTLINRLGAF
jgi:flagellar hook-associated protein 1 FlgK